jgi:GGDEF domain-containing protein
LFREAAQVIDPRLVPLLKGAELFQSLLEDDIRYLASASSLRKLSEGEELFPRGSRADRFFIVAEGELSVMRAGEGRKEREIARFLRGEVIGDFDFAIGRKRSDAVSAAIPSIVIVFPEDGRSLASLAAEQPGAISRMTLKSLVMVSSRLRAAHALIKENAPWVRELRLQVHTDPSTGLWSRAFLDEELPSLIKRPTAVISLKPDRFKALVDDKGHGTGDAAMLRIAARLKETAGRAGGWALRLASNQTALVLPGAGPAIARELAENSARSLAVPEAGSLQLGFSAAYGVWPDDCADFRELLDRCEKVMMRIWKGGGGKTERVPGTGSLVKAALP